MTRRDLSLLFLWSIAFLMPIGCALIGELFSMLDPPVYLADYYLSWPLVFLLSFVLCVATITLSHLPLGIRVALIVGTAGALFGEFVFIVVVAFLLTGFSGMQ